eukprot:Clim_evm2s56 gene=Clim_evmTU2s56
MDKRRYDIVIFGATGTTGRQAAKYMARYAPENLKWAIAGRSFDKLKKIATEVQGHMESNRVDIIVASVDDVYSVQDMVSKAKVIATTVGPYAKYGEVIVKTCIEFGRDYLDLTGEGYWVREMIRKYGDHAKSKGCRIIPFSGFDSVPSDLGVWSLYSFAQKNFGDDLKAVESRLAGAGGVNGGTIQSALGMFDHDPAMKTTFDTYALVKGIEGRSDTKQYGSEASRKDALLPTYNDVTKSWSPLFFMALINVRVVNRSNILLLESAGKGYGKTFVYTERMWVPGFLSIIFAWIVTLVLAISALLMRIPLTRSVIKMVAPGGGTAPPEWAMEKGFFTGDFTAKTESGRVLKLTMKDKGDPGNKVTVKCMCECAMALVLNREELPHRSGFLTPAAAFEDVLVNRLRKAGMTWEIEEYSTGRVKAE